MSRGNPFAGTTALDIVRPWDEFTGADFLKADNSGNWSLNDAPPDPGLYLPLNYRHILQRWGEEKRATIIDEDPLPSVESVNKEIPIEEWLHGHDGKPKPPWEHTLQLVLINLRTGAQVIFSVSSKRGKVTVSELINAIRGKIFIVGRAVTPVVELSNAPFKTKDFGTQKRGAFKMTGRWIDIGGRQQVLSGPALKELPSPSIATEPGLNDEIPDFVDEVEAETPPPVVKKKAAKR